jgi:hypothetical protein
MGSSECIVGLYLTVNKSNNCAGQNAIYLPRFFLHDCTRCNQPIAEGDQ